MNKRHLAAFVVVGLSLYSYLYPRMRVFDVCGKPYEFQIPRDFDRAVAIIYGFNTDNYESKLIDIVERTSQGDQSRLFEVEKSNSSQFHLRPVQGEKWSAGIYSLPVHEINKGACLRIEYRQTAIKFLTEAMSVGDTRFIIVSVLALLQFIMLLHWVYFRRHGVVVVALLLSVARTWIITPPLMGYDDTYHLSGILREATGLPTEEIKSQIRDYTFSTPYFLLHGTDQKLVKKLIDDPTLCPHNLVQIHPEFCNGSGDQYAQFVGHWGYLFGLAKPSSLETLAKVFNTIFLFVIGAIIVKILFSYFSMPLVEALMLTLAAFLVNYGLLSNAMGVFGDYLTLVKSGVILWLAFAIRDHRYKWFLGFGVGVLTITLLVDDRSSVALLIFYVMLLPFHLSGEISKRFKYLYVVLILMGSALVFFLLAQIPVIKLNHLIPHWTQAHHYRELFHWYSMALTGSLISGKWGMPTFVKWILISSVAPLLWVGYLQAKDSALPGRRFIARSLLLVSILAPTALFLLGFLTANLNWMSMRFLYPLLSAPILLLALSGRRFPTWLIVVALLNQITAPANIELFAYWMRQNFYP